MATEVRLPRLGFSMTEGVLTEWLVGDGSSVRQGQPLFAVEMEKAVQEVEAPASGTLKILVQPSDDPVNVGTLLAEIV